MSSISDVSIANLALVELGQSRIIAFTDQSKAARSVNAIYAMERDRELRSHLWNFATKRAILPALAGFTPAYGFKYAYQKPFDCLRIISVGDFAPGAGGLEVYRGGQDEVQYRLEGPYILYGRYLPQIAAAPPANPPTPVPLRLRYTAQITDSTQFDAGFVDALAMRLAWKLAEELTQSAQKKKDAAEAYEESIVMALRSNSIETPPEQLNDGSWLRSRLPG
jgi:hypothetical protein